VRFPSLKDFKRSLKGRKGYVLLLSNPSGENVQEMLIQGPLTDDQYERLDKLIQQIVSEKAASWKPGEPFTTTTYEEPRGS
jgi:hypothetical protein